jgi:hypothetical protein
MDEFVDHGRPFVDAESLAGRSGKDCANSPTPKDRFLHWSSTRRTAMPIGCLDLAAELVRLPVDVIVATFTPCALAAKRQQHQIVVAALADPVGDVFLCSITADDGHFCRGGNRRTHRQILGTVPRRCVSGPTEYPPLSFVNRPTLIAAVMAIVLSRLR